MESEKINVPSSETESANLSAEKAKNCVETSLNPSKETSLSSDTSLAKTNDKNQESFPKSKTETNGLTVYHVKISVFGLKEITAFDVLKVTFMSTSNEIKKAFHKQALKWHPDKSPLKIDQSINTHKFQKLVNCYKKNKHRRKIGYIITTSQIRIICCQWPILKRKILRTKFLLLQKQ